jgi:membrane-associated protease RseP (regulator of RpoE activity)
MNRSTLMLHSMLVAAVLSVPAFADDAKPAAPNAPAEELRVEGRRVFTGGEEPRPGEFMVSGKLNGAARMERAAFLGVGAAGVDATLRSQLDLPKGVGLTISYVEKDGPAEKAGLQQHDILQKLNDQILVNAPQLATLVRTFKAGDEVTLTVIRKGKPMELKAKLIERDLPPLADAGDPFTFNFAPEPARIEDAAGRRRLAEAYLGNARIWAEQADSSKPRIIRLSPDSTRMISRDDGTHSIQISQRGEDTTISIKDATGKSLFDGPYNTPEEREKLPAELREKVQKMLANIDMKSSMPTTNPSEPKAEVDRALERLFDRHGLAT